jgi:hypothetical protein
MTVLTSSARDAQSLLEHPRLRWLADACVLAGLADARTERNDDDL